MSRWKYFAVGDTPNGEVPRGVYDPEGTLRLIIMKDATRSHDALNEFGREVADLLNTHDAAVEAIAKFDAEQTS